MSKSFYPKGIDWEGDGYFAVPIPRKDPAFAKDRYTRGWLCWEDTLRKAQRGDFSTVLDLLELHRAPQGWVLGQSCAYLMGDAGRPPLYRQLADTALNGPVDYVARIECCDALAAWGSLTAVPTLLTTYLSIHKDFNDADIIPVLLSELLESEPGPLSVPEACASDSAYRDLVMGRLQELTDKLGTQEIIVLRGEPFGVVRLARLLLGAIREPVFPLDLRRKFEASTGVDCSPFFQNGILQRLTAAAIVEGFLESPAVDRFEPGVRYFFGHRIPD
jgi:hypothetical protein